MIKALFTSKHLWIKLGLVALGIRTLFLFFPELAQTVYQRGLFQVFRVVWDYTLGLMPFPLIYLLVVVFPLWIWYKRLKSKKVFYWRKLPLGLASVFGFVFFWFHVLWAFNYQCPGLFSEPLELADDLTIEEMTFRAATIATARRAQFDRHAEVPLEQELRSLVENTMTDFDYPVWGNVRCRVVSKSGVLRRLGLLGIYFPFVGEGHADGSQLNICLPFTMTHEMSHGYGVTDEGEANYVAWQSLYNSQKPKIQYQADLQLLRSCLSKWKFKDHEAYVKFRSELDSAVIEDLNAINENIRQHPLYFPGVAESVNDAYLKTQGVSAGVESYGEFVYRCFDYIHSQP